MAKITKTFIAKSETNTEARTVTSLISTQAIDRDGDVIMADGMDATDFIKSPTVFWNHDYAMPIGTGTLSKGDGFIQGITKFPERPESHEGEWFPDTVLSLFVAGVIKGFSIGFNPLDNGVRRANKADVQKFGEGVLQVFSKWKLFEYSVAPLPANQDALAIAVNKSMLTKAQAGTMFPGTEIVVPQRKTVIFFEEPARKPKRSKPTKSVSQMVAIAIKKRQGVMYE
jgi:phage head maturation protease